jgi:hypothetical protein
VTNPFAGAALRHDHGAFTVVPGARQLEGPAPDAPDAMIRRLAGALVPLADHHSAWIRSVWIVLTGEDAPRLVTLIPEEKR